jgi:hypothetical protein
MKLELENISFYESINLHNSAALNLFDNCLRRVSLGVPSEILVRQEKQSNATRD